MRVLLLIVATGVAALVAFAAARAISAARLDHALRAQAPTPEDVAAVMSATRVEALPTRAQAGTPQPLAPARSPSELHERTA